MLAPIPKIVSTSHSCKRDKHELCAGRYLLLKKTGKTPATGALPEADITAILVCPCEKCKHG